MDQSRFPEFLTEKKFKNGINKYKIYDSWQSQELKKVTNGDSRFPSIAIRRF